MPQKRADGTVKSFCEI